MLGVEDSSVLLASATRRRKTNVGVEDSLP